MENLALTLSRTEEHGQNSRLRKFRQMKCPCDDNRLT